MTKFTTFAAAALILSLTACGGSAPDAGPPPLEGARMGGAFSLINQDGKTTTDKDFTGKYRLIYFGYTFCPDICPVDAQLMGQALTLFEKEDQARAAKLVPIFISVDPARDTPAIVKQFVSNFHPRMVGLTGSVAQIDEMAQRYGVAFMRDKPNAQGAYLVNHARMIVLYGPQGEPIAIMPQGDDPKAVVAEISRWVR
jgi:protein SCO1/2